MGGQANVTRARGDWFRNRTTLAEFFRQERQHPQFPEGTFTTYWQRWLRRQHEYRARWDPVSAQEWEAVNGSSYIQSAERTLLRAVLEQALLDLFRRGVDRKAQDTVADAYRWIADTKDESRFSFNFIAEHVLNTSPTRLRAVILADYNRVREDYRRVSRFKTSRPPPRMVFLATLAACGLLEKFQAALRKKLGAAWEREEKRRQKKIAAIEERRKKRRADIEARRAKAAEARRAAMVGERAATEEEYQAKVEERRLARLKRIVEREQRREQRRTEREEQRAERARERERHRIFMEQRAIEREQEYLRKREERERLMEQRAIEREHKREERKRLMEQRAIEREQEYLRKREERKRLMEQRAVEREQEYLRKREEREQRERDRQSRLTQSVWERLETIRRWRYKNFKT